MARKVCGRGRGKGIRWFTERYSIDTSNLSPENSFVKPIGRFFHAFFSAVAVFRISPAEVTSIRGRLQGRKIALARLGEARSRSSL